MIFFFCSKFNVGMVIQNSDTMGKEYTLFYLAIKKGKCLLLGVVRVCADFKL